MSTDNVTPIRQEKESITPKPRKRRHREPPPPNTFDDMPSNLELVIALEGVCAVAERLAWAMNASPVERKEATEEHLGVAIAGRVLSQMLRVSLTNQSII